jgi:hypothetical protein
MSTRNPPETGARTREAALIPPLTKEVGRT